MKHILLLTDFTVKSQEAHQFAFDYFEGIPCMFHLLSIQKVWDYTVDDLMSSKPTQVLDEALLGSHKRKLAARLEQLESEFEGSSFHFKAHVDYDVFTDAIKQTVEIEHIDLIVCGTDGPSSILEHLFSSHTLRIIYKVDCPVLVVPEGVPYEAPRRIQYLLDHDDVFEHCGKELLIELMQRFAPEIHVLYLGFGKETSAQSFGEDVKAVAALFPEAKLTSSLIPEKNAVTKLQQYQDHFPVQLVVLSARKASFLERIFSNSHLAEVVNTTKVPMLLLRDCNA